MPASATSSIACWRRPSRAAAVATLDLTAVRRELDDALRVTTEKLSEITNLLAVATAPAVDSATIHRIEVLTLQPSVVMVVIITSSGGVSKYVGAFDDADRPGPRRLGGGVPQRARRRAAAGCADVARPPRRP